jgi:hypothetical protein
MKDDKINFSILFRKPKVPVIVLSKGAIWPAFNIKELGTICVISASGDDSNNLKAIDSSGEEFWYFPDRVYLTPGFMAKKWTKKRIIELFNNSETAKEKNIQYSLKSLSNKSLPTIVTDICYVLKNNILEKGPVDT